MQKNPNNPNAAEAGQADSRSQRSDTEERRALPRQSAEAMTATVRPKGHLSRQAAQVLDFNHSGIAVVTARQLPTERPLFVSLVLDELCIDSVVAVAHNSCACQGGYRSGLQFRCDSELQLDSEEITATLKAMEAKLDGDHGNHLEWVEVSCG